MIALPNVPEPQRRHIVFDLDARMSAPGATPESYVQTLQILLPRLQTVVLPGPGDPYWAAVRGCGSRTCAARLR